MKAQQMTTSAHSSQVHSRALGRCGGFSILRLPCHSHSPCSLQTLFSILQLSRQRDDPFLKVKHGVVDLQGAASATFCNVQLLLGKPPGQAQCGPGHVEVVCSSGDLRYHAGVGRPGFGFALRVSLHVMGSRNSTVY